MWQWHLTYLKRVKRQSPDTMLRFEKINVAHQVIVNFTDKTLVFTDTRTNTELRRYIGSILILFDVCVCVIQCALHGHALTWIYRVEDILFLHTFDALGNVDEFRENGKNEKGMLIPFPGPGVLTYLIRYIHVSAAA